MVCQVTSTDARHGFQIVTDYITDPATDTTPATGPGPH
jgi:hypothetical protein